MNRRMQEILLEGDQPNLPPRDVRLVMELANAVRSQMGCIPSRLPLSIDCLMSYCGGLHNVATDNPTLRSHTLLAKDYESDAIRGLYYPLLYPSPRIWGLTRKGWIHATFEIECNHLGGHLYQRAKTAQIELTTLPDLLAATNEPTAYFAVCLAQDLTAWRDHRQTLLQQAILMASTANDVAHICRQLTK